MAEDIIQLNVGGTAYTTTLATLRRYPDSMLGAMFNGSMPTRKDPNGQYFIDRDGTLFIHVLNFLRSSQLALPDEFALLDSLAVEADFYQIVPLIEAIQQLRNKRTTSDTSCGRLLEIVEVRTGTSATMPTNNSRVKSIISGGKTIIGALPSEFFKSHVERLQHISDQDFTEVELFGSNTRLKLGEYLQNHGWKLLGSNVSSSSSFNNSGQTSIATYNLILEQTFRDRWFLPDKDNKRWDATVSKMRKATMNAKE